MAERRVYTPTDYIEKAETRHVVFLAGPIQGTPDWRKEAISRIKRESREIVIASPRRDYHPEEFDYVQQVDWETYHIKRAGENGAIMFWFPKESKHNSGKGYERRTEVILGICMVRHERDGVKLSVGIERGFSEERHIRRVFNNDYPEVPVLDNLRETCLSVVKLLK